MLTTLLNVAIGGALGASARYLSGVGLMRLVGAQAFPVGIITVNVVGSFLMGVFVAVAAKKGLTGLNPFIATGFLGGFTTFSSFSLEAVTLWERGDHALAAAYVLGSVILSLAALLLGLMAARGLVA